MAEHKKLLAVILILLGAVAFIGNFVPIFQFSLIWPVIIIIFGLGIMFKEIC